MLGVRVGGSSWDFILSGTNFENKNGNLSFFLEDEIQELKIKVGSVVMCWLALAPPSLCVEFASSPCSSVDDPPPDTPASSHSPNTCMLQ